MTAPLNLLVFKSWLKHKTLNSIADLTENTRKEGVFNGKSFTCLQFAYTALFLDRWAGKFELGWLTVPVTAAHELLNMSFLFSWTVILSRSTALVCKSSYTQISVDLCWYSLSAGIEKIGPKFTVRPPGAVAGQI